MHSLVGCSITRGSIGSNEGDMMRASLIVAVVLSWFTSGAAWSQDSVRIGFLKGHWDGPSHVLTGGNAILHHHRCDPYTIRERARIQGFPDDFTFYGTVMGGRGGIFTTVTSAAANTVSKAVVNLASRSRMRNRNRVACSPMSINTLRAAWATHAPVGWAVTPARCTRRRSISRMNSTYNRVSPTVSTVRKSQARTPAAWTRRRSAKLSIPSGSPQRRSHA